MKVKPIVKWAGGKRQLMENIIKLMPENYNKYYEPFIGGGALLFELMPEEATINDINTELMSIYHCLSNEKYFNLMINSLKKHEENHSEAYYLQVREKDKMDQFENLNIWEKAARTIYLNKTCFNGLYRVNKSGYFNVPSGKKVKAKTYDKDNIKLLHEYFLNKHITILNTDFEIALQSVKKGDFVYFDPPYDSLDNSKSFTAYTKFNFTKEDQIRLFKCYDNLSNSGAYLMLSNNNTPFINELYEDYNIHIVNAKRMINSNGKGRGNVEEVLITNY